MAYASVANMIERFGLTEMIRTSRPEDLTAETPDPVKIETALGDASSTIDGYLRDRYVVPVALPPKDVIRTACVLARYDLAKGERTEPTEQMRLDRKEAIAWLEGIAKGLILIDAPSAGHFGKDNGPRIGDRETIFSDGSLRDW